MNFHENSVTETLEFLDTTEAGLDSSQVSERQAKFGRNELADKQHKTIFDRIKESLSDPMVLILVFAAIVQAIVNFVEKGGNWAFQEYAEVVIMLAVVLINTVISIVQEYKSDNSIEALKKMTSATAHVMRDDKAVEVDAAELVPGDVVILTTGAQVPADCRLIECNELVLDESVLTGESKTVAKFMSALELKPHEQTPLAERKNMVYKGTYVASGNGKAVVVATGVNTEVGKISSSIATADAGLTPLQLKMAELAKILTRAILALSIVYLGICLLQTFVFHTMGTGDAVKDILELFITAIALAIAAMPEGLPAVITIIMSLGVSTMARKNALVRKLNAVDTLGCTQVICSDKTGTLTQNKMTVVRAQSESQQLFDACCYLCNNAELSTEGQWLGNSTDKALAAYAADSEVGHLVGDTSKVSEKPFSSSRKMMSTVHKINPELRNLGIPSKYNFVQFTKGAAAYVLDRATNLMQNLEVQELNPDTKSHILGLNDNMADDALRVIACAVKFYETEEQFQNCDDIEQGLTYLGIAGIKDPVRPTAAEAIKTCKNAGMRPIIITGDQINTAAAIALELGIIKDKGEAILGNELDNMTDAELAEAVNKYSVFARVRPEHKTMIVKALKMNNVVAMTGDGVNDAPSIKAADIGICMGVTGADVTKDASDIVLTDDNYGTIVTAVEQGRKIYENIKKVLQSQLSMNLSEVITVLIIGLLGTTILNPVQLLVINMVVETLPVIALGLEKPEANLMKRNPRGKNTSIFEEGLGTLIIVQGIILAALQLVSALIATNIIGCTGASVSAYVYMTTCFTGIFCALNMRSRTRSIFSKHMFKNLNWWLLGACAIMFLLTIVPTLFGGLQGVLLNGVSWATGWQSFTVGVFTAGDVIFCIGVSLLTFPIFELIKFIIRRSNKG